VDGTVVRRLEQRRQQETYRPRADHMHAHAHRGAPLQWVDDPRGTYLLCGRLQLVRACDRGGRDHPPGSRGAIGPTRTMQPMERKVATVLFADLVDSTGLVSSADPEVVRQRVNRYFEAVSGRIEAHGGTVEKFAGDAVMAAFGVPLTHEDDAERAVRA